ncbi:integral membrane protein [Metarhizium guizhouense ARSEF 977]|uniref:Integral membrane protein n=1 Tax=Metarhizium guizhouense (strain ARSEF 977) TaxID=1276136 RepID=A0A0B4HW24_METGA|nr:integral membrane protein [Metarhizium guizhouense ARSEF 977]
MFRTEPPGRGPSSRAQIIMALTWSFWTFAILSVCLRFYIGFKCRQRVALDDWVMLVALACHTLFQTFLTLAYVTGVETMTMKEIIAMSKWQWGTVPVNLLANTVSRASIAIMLVQIFGVHKWFRRAIITVTTAVTTLGFINFLFVFFQTRPFQASWDIRIVPEWRLPPLAHYILTFILCALSDFMYAFFPIIFIWRLKLATRKKVGLIFVMTGSFITMVAAIGRVVIIRYTLTGGAESALDSDRIYVLFGISNLLASVEVSLVIILGSLPKLKAATKLRSFQAISSSFNSLIGRLRTGAQSDGPPSATNYGRAESDIELCSSHRH